MFLDRRLTSRASKDSTSIEADAAQVREHGWFLEFVFRGDELVENSPVAEILDALIHTGLPHSARQNVHTIINELYINALDYGVLCLDAQNKSDELNFYHFADQRQQRLEKLMAMEFVAAQWIKIECLLDISNRPSLEIIVADSGSGIGHTDSARKETSDSNAFGGRGLTLVRELASQVNIQAKSNQIKVLYKC